MAIIITYPSAIEYWLLEKGIRVPFYRHALDARVKTKSVFAETFSRQDQLYAPDQFSFCLPLHLGVPKSAMREETDSLKMHLLSEHLPDNSFVEVAAGVYVCSPELCFLQAARDLSLHELVLLGNELCAIYKRDPYSPYNQSRRDMLMTKKSLNKFLDGAKDIKGVKNAKRAAQYILERANSPIEARLAVLAALPFRYGGYGLKNTLLNYFVRMTPKGAEHLGRTSCCCDMVWKEEKVVLEYDSNLSHLDIDQHFYDKKRSTALTFSGYKVISVTAEQIRDFRGIEQLFLSVRNAVGLKNRKDIVQKYFELRREVIQRIMFTEFI